MKISQDKKDRISEQILAFLFSASPKAQFTAHISREIARDEEFTKKLLLRLKAKGLVTEIRKNPSGTPYKKRSRWKLSDQAYSAYKKHNNPTH